jgi:hypothetical protein
MKIHLRINFNCSTLETEPTCYDSATASVFVGEYQACSTARLMIVGSLEREGRFTRIHCSAVINEFGHAGI